MMATNKSSATHSADRGRRRQPVQAGAAGPVKIMVVDSHALVRQGFAVLLRDLFPKSVIVEAADGGEAITAAASNADCRLVLIDLGSLDGAGPGIVAKLARKLPRAAIAVLAASGTASDIVDSYRAGARGFIAKSTRSDVLAPALQLILSGETFISSCGMQALTDAMPEPPLRERRPAEDAPTLTARQTEILNLLAQGLPNRDIARRLGMLEGTVKVHVKTILQKLGVHNRTHAVVTGMRLGLIPIQAVLSGQGC